MKKLPTIILVLATTAFASFGLLPMHTIEGVANAFTRLANSDAASISSVGTPSPTPTPVCVTWQNYAFYPLPLYDAAVTTDGTYVYAFNGRGHDFYSDANRYDPRNNVWTPITPHPNGNEYRHRASYGGNGKIYVIGGLNNRRMNRIYDIATNSWSQGADVPAPVNLHSQIFYNGKIYVLGGGGTSQNPVFAYEIATNTWTTLNSMPGSQSAAAAGIINGKIYVAAGSQNGFDPVDTLFIYDIATNTWAAGPSLSNPFFLGAGTVFENEFWVLGGNDSTTTFNTARIYNPTSNTWRNGPPMLEARTHASAVTVNTSEGEKMFVIGGRQSTTNTPLSTVEGSIAVCTPSPTPTPTLPPPSPTATPTPSPTATPTPPFPTPTIPVSPIVRDGSMDYGFSLVAGEAGNGEVNSVTAAPGNRMYVGGGFGSILGVPVKNIARVYQDGVVDQSFNVGAGPNSAVRRIFVQGDGKVLVSGAFTSFDGAARNNIVRLNEDGSVDTTFNVISDATQLNICDIQPDGRILVCGNFNTINGAARKQVARLEVSGSVDLSFDFGTGLPGSGFINVIKILPDGKMLIGGNFSSVNGTVREGIARLNSNGSVDTSYTFGTAVSFIQDIQITADGKFVVATINRVFRALADGSLDASFNSDNSFSSTVRFAKPLPDGKVMVGGHITQSRVGPVTVFTKGVVRLSVDGTIDTSFTSAVTESPLVYTGFVDSDGKITIGGGFIRLGVYNPVGLARLNTDGSRDVSFVGRLLARSFVSASLTEPGGKIMLAGSFDTLNSSSRKHVGRINPDGSVDETFVPDPVAAAPMAAIVRQPDGKYIFGGSTDSTGNGGLFRLNSDGTLDTSFQRPTLNGFTFVSALALQADGKILVGGGFGTVNGSSRRSFARLNSDGSLDGMIVGIPDGPSRIEEFILQPDGRIIMAGGFPSVNGNTAVRNIARLNADGSLDLQFSANHGGSFSQVKSLTMINGALYVGANFDLVGQSNFRRMLVKMNQDGVVDHSFNVGHLVGSDVHAVSVAPHGKLLVGGTFRHFGESGNRNSLVRVLSNGGLDYTFDAGPIVGSNGPTSEAIFSLATLPNNKLFVGGLFISMGPATRWGAARLDINQKVTRAVSDFDGDAKSDIAVFRPSNSVWYWSKSWDNATRATAWGIATDAIAPADYDGDGVTDVAVFRPSEGRWYILQSASSTFVAGYWGNSNDVVAPADFDGDGAADIAIFRPSTGTWWISGTQTGPVSVGFGGSGDKPVVADYDGDGKADIAIYRPSLGQWWINRSTAGVIAFTFGSATDKPVQGDYTGDGKADVGFFRPSTGEWYILRSEDFSYYSQPFGATGDIPSPGDFDGDAKFDPTVYRPSSATWFSQRSTAGTLIQQFGSTGDQPVPNAFVP